MPYIDELIPMIEKHQGNPWEEENMNLTIQELGFDSLTTVDLIVDIEDRFSIMLEPQDVEVIESHNIRELSDFIQKRIEQSLR